MPASLPLHCTASLAPGAVASSCVQHGQAANIDRVAHYVSILRILGEVMDHFGAVKRHIIVLTN